jgi:hypothetical protein
MEVSIHVFCMLHLYSTYFTVLFHVEICGFFSDVIASILPWVPAVLAGLSSK